MMADTFSDSPSSGPDSPEIKQRWYSSPCCYSRSSDEDNDLFVLFRPLSSFESDRLSESTSSAGVESGASVKQTQTTRNDDCLASPSFSSSASNSFDNINVESKESSQDGLKKIKELFICSYCYLIKPRQSYPSVKSSDILFCCHLCLQRRLQRKVAESRHSDSTNHRDNLRTISSPSNASTSSGPESISDSSSNEVLSPKGNTNSVSAPSGFTHSQGRSLRVDLNQNVTLSNAIILRGILDLEDEKNNMPVEPIKERSTKGSIPHPLLNAGACKTSEGKSHQLRNIILLKDSIQQEYDIQFKKNPILASMLAQTPQTSVFSAARKSEIRAILSQMPQEKLPKNLEEKIGHTLITAGVTIKCPLSTPKLLISSTNDDTITIPQSLAPRLWNSVQQNSANSGLSAPTVSVATAYSEILNNATSVAVGASGAQSYQYTAVTDQDAIPKENYSKQLEKNPILVSMLAPTPQTSIFSAAQKSEIRTILSQMPQKKLLKDLEEKLGHTPITAGVTIKRPPSTANLPISSANDDTIIIPQSLAPSLWNSVQQNSANSAQSTPAVPEVAQSARTVSEAAMSPPTVSETTQSPPTVSEATAFSGIRNDADSVAVGAGGAQSCQNAAVTVQVQNNNKENQRTRIKGDTEAVYTDGEWQEPRVNLKKYHLIEENVRYFKEYLAKFSFYFDSTGRKIKIMKKAEKDKLYQSSPAVIKNENSLLAEESLERDPCVVKNQNSLLAEKSLVEIVKKERASSTSSKKA